MNPDDSHLDRLLSELAARLNLGPLDRDERGACAIVFDQRINVTFQPDPDRPAQLWLLSELGTVTPDRELYETLLQGNLLWHATAGATISLTDDDPPRAILATQVTWPGLDCNSLYESVGVFTDAAQMWMEVVTGAPQYVSDSGQSRGAALGLPMGLRV